MSFMNVYKSGRKFLLLCALVTLAACATGGYDSARDGSTKLDSISNQEKEPITVLSFSPRIDETPDIEYSAQKETEDLLQE